MSGGAPYEQIILDAFRDHARKKLEAEGGKLEWKVAIKGYDKSPKHGEGKKEWDGLMQNVRERYAGSNLDYLVGVGSFASTALNNSDLMSRQVAKRGLIFLGVTDPLGANLVKRLKGREEDTEIAGVRYGAGAEAYATCIAALFPKGQKLVFVREVSSPQDQYMAKELEKMKLTGRLNLTDATYRSQLEPDQLADDNAIYFAWYGFDNVLADVSKSDAKLLLAKKVVPSTFTAENLKGAGIVVSVDDSSVGVAGAELMLSAILDKKVLGQLDVRDVPFKYWIDLQTVNTKGIQLTPWVNKKTSNEGHLCPT
jgi:ABC-type uncharacterized transport system substrate-binding protein